jgi:hypothetical protein
MQNVKCRNTSGNMVFYDINGSIIATFDGTNRIFQIPTGSTLTVAGVTVDSSTLAMTGLTATAAELNKNAGVTAGTATASKTAVLGTSKNLDILGLPVGGLKIGTAGAEVVVTPSAAELNLLKDAALANSTASVAAILDASKRLRTNANVGTVTTGATTSAVEIGDGLSHTTILTLTNFAVGTSGDNAAKAIGASLYSLPAGTCLVESSYISVGLTLADAIQTDTPEIGLGTAVGTGVVATLGAVGATAENIWEGEATANVSGTAKVGAKNPTASVPLVITAGGSHDIYLNCAVSWADITAPAAVTATGTVVINWKFFA